MYSGYQSKWEIRMKLSDEEPGNRSSDTVMGCSAGLMCKIWCGHPVLIDIECRQLICEWSAGGLLVVENAKRIYNGTNMLA